MELTFVDFIAACCLAIGAIGFWACIISLRADDSLGFGLKPPQAIAVGLLFLLAALIAAAHLVGMGPSFG